MRLTSLTRLAVAAATALVTFAAGLATAAPAQADNVVTPGNFTGYGFDQCLAPTQAKMDAWLTSSPFWAVGIYISGDSRFCRDQPNLTPTWVSTQLRKGWRLLPITLGPQAWCTTRDRYLRQVRINPSPSGSYSRARAQARAEASEAVSVAKRLGISRGSTLWYDLEAFNISPTDCRESALSFLSAWTYKLQQLGYVSGVYSSAASGIKMLDDARVNRPGRYRMPDRVWIADWNGRADVHSTYIRSTGWMPHKRVHQYRGGHNETHGGVTINIDSNWLDLGRGSTIAREPKHCGGAATYNVTWAVRGPGSRGTLVKTIQCMLKAKGRWPGAVDGVYDDALGRAVSSFRVSRGIHAGKWTTQGVWVALMSHGATQPVLKYGSASVAVRRVQRALNAADRAGLRVTGVFDHATTAAVKSYQGEHRRSRTGVVTPSLWRLWHAGVR